MTLDDLSETQLEGYSDRQLLVLLVMDAKEQRKALVRHEQSCPAAAAVRQSGRVALGALIVVLVGGLAALIWRAIAG